MATIIVQPGGARAGKQRVDLTAIAHNRLMLLLILFMLITGVVILRLTWVGIFSGSGRGGDVAAGLRLPPVQEDAECHRRREERGEGDEGADEGHSRSG